MTDNKLCLKIKAALSQEPGILAAYLIGSVVSGSLTPESDFDLVVVARNRRVTDDNKVYQLIRQLNFPKDLDLSVVDSSSSPVFLYQIISKGKRIYAKDPAKADDFEAFSLHNYYDNAHMREIYNQALKKKFSYAD